MLDNSVWFVILYNNMYVIFTKWCVIFIFTLVFAKIINYLVLVSGMLWNLASVLPYTMHLTIGKCHLMYWHLPPVRWHQISTNRQSGNWQVAL